MPLSYMHAIMYKIHKACLGIPSTTSTTFCFFDSLQTSSSTALTLSFFLFVSLSGNFTTLSAPKQNEEVPCVLNS